MSFGALEHLATESSAVLASSSRVPPPPPHQLGSPSGLLTDSSRPAAEAEAVVEAVAEEEEEERMEEEEEERMEELVYVLVDLQSQELAFEVDWRQATEALAGEQDVEMDVEMDAQPADPNTKAAMEAEEQADSQSQDSGSDSYYDTQDPFIDDSDIFGSGVAAKRPSTEIGGFFAQAGNAVVQIKAGDEEEAKTTSIKKKKRKRKPSTELNSSQKSESNVASPLGKVPKIDSSEMINMERQPGNSTLKILPEKAKEVFTAELSLAIQELVEHLSEIRSREKKSTFKIPRELDPFMLKIQRLMILQVHPKSRKFILLHLGKLLDITTIKTLKNRFLLVLDDWKISRVESLMELRMQTLSKKIHGEVQKFLISQQEKDKKQNSSTSDLNELSSQKSSSSFRCRWEIFAEDILYCMACSELLVELKSRTDKPKPKPTSEVNSEVSSLGGTPKRGKAERLKIFRAFKELWPTDFPVQVSHINEAMKRYKSKFWKDPKILEIDIEVEDLVEKQSGRIVSVGADLKRFYYSSVEPTIETQKEKVSSSESKSPSKKLKPSSLGSSPTRLSQIPASVSNLPASKSAPSEVSLAVPKDSELLPVMGTKFPALPHDAWGSQYFISSKAVQAE